MSMPHRVLIVLSVLLTAAVIALLVVKGFSTADREVQDDRVAVQQIRPKQVLKNSRHGMARWPSDPLQQIDLLDVIDTNLSAVEGTWGFDGETLVTSAVPWGRIQIPCIPPEEYDLTILIKRVSGYNSFNIGLVTGERSFMVVLDGGDGVTSGLDLVAGKGFSDNDTTFRGKTLWPKKEMTVTCSVRKTGTSLVVDGNTIFDWKGDYSRLGQIPLWQTLNKKTLWVGTWETSFRIREMVLMPVSGKWTKAS